MSIEAELYDRLLEKEALDFSTKGRLGRGMVAGLTALSTNFTPAPQAAHLDAAQHMQEMQQQGFMRQAAKGPQLNVNKGMLPPKRINVTKPFRPANATSVMGNVAFPKAGALRKQAMIATMARFGLR